MDHALVRALNSWFAGGPFRSDLDRFLAIAPLVAIAGLVIFSWLADWGRAPERRAVLIIGIGGAILAFLLNLGIGHLYYRPRPYVAIPSIRALLPQHPDSSFYADQVCIAAALSAGLLVTRRRLGLAAFALTVVLGIARVGAGVHYPSDVLAAALAGAVAFLVLLPLRGPVSRLVAVMAGGETKVHVPSGRETASFVVRNRPLVVAGAILAAFGLGYGIRALTDLGRTSAADRAEAVLRPPPASAVPDEYQGTTVAALASGSYTATHAAVAGQVEQVTHEPDGDIHLRIVSGGAFIVAEIIPEFPLTAPSIGQKVITWGIVRHDSLHNWWELHPLIGWMPGSSVVQGSPGPGVGD